MKRAVVSIVIVGILTLLRWTSPSFAVETAPPFWENSVIAHIWINKSNDMLDIKGTDLLDLHYGPLEEARKSGIEGEKNKKAFEKSLEEAVAFLALTKTIDNEVGRFMSTRLGPNRVEFAIRQILIENAVNCEKVKTTVKRVWDPATRTTKKIKVGGSDLGLYPSEGLFKWFKECFQTEADRASQEKRPFYGMNYLVDWDYSEGGLSDMVQILEPIAPAYGPPWLRHVVQVPKFGVPFEKPPETLLEFRKKVETELNASLRLFARELVWRTLVSSTYPASVWTAATVVFNDEMKKRIETVRQLNEFFGGEELHATISSFKLSGVSAGSARIKMRRWIDEKLIIASQKIADENRNATADSRSPREFLRLIRVTKIMLDARKNGPQELLAQLNSEFADDIASGALAVTTSEHSVDYNGSDQLPTDNSISTRELKMAVSPLIKWVVFPYFDVNSEGGSIEFRLLKEIHGNSLKDTRIEDVIREQISSKQLTYQSRELIRRTFEENRIVIVQETCRDPAWPCLKFDAKIWADRLLSEVLYPADVQVDGPISFDNAGRLKEVMKFQSIPIRESSFLTY